PLRLHASPTRRSSDLPASIPAAVRASLATSAPSQTAQRKTLGPSCRRVGNGSSRLSRMSMSESGMRMVDQLSPFDPQTTFEMPGASQELTTTAPAASPRSKEVERASGASVSDSFSAPMPRTLSMAPAPTRRSGRDVVHGARPDECIGLGDAVAVAGAGGADVPGGNGAGAQTIGQCCRRRGREVREGHRGDDDSADVLGFETGGGDGLECGLFAHVEHADVLACAPAGDDAGA